MPIKNRIKEFIESKGITAYRFQKDTGLAPKTVYDLCNDPWQVPHITTLNKICDLYKIQPNELMVWVDPDELSEVQEKELSDLVADNISKLKEYGFKLATLTTIANKESLPTPTDFAKITSILDIPEERKKRLWKTTYSPITKEIKDETDTVNGNESTKDS